MIVVVVVLLVSVVVYLAGLFELSVVLVPVAVLIKNKAQSC